MTIKTRLMTLALGTAVLAVAACNNSSPATTPTGPQPTIGTASSPAPTSVPSAAAPASPTPAPQASGVTFNETFTESSLDPAVWTVFPQGGMVTSGNGLNLLVPGNSPTFPYLYTTQEIFPASGPFYFEMHYQLLALGNNNVAFCLDYEPPSKPGVAALTRPFLVMDSNLAATFNTESGPKSVVIPHAAQPGSSSAAHRIRVEFDGTDTYRFIFDNTEYTRVTSTRRPLRFWIGVSPNTGATNSSWPAYTIPSITAGVLTSPDPATPVSTASATPSPAAS